ncbi:Bacterial regulatory protein, Fis family [Acidipropionibacterium jensenii]|uniref:Bacterial regulatory protein, Fis family n=1 Tax=Acidipropionibacterium jensenii TaxID=1749 RepID=A0A448P1S1_9ACTN|nr:helix-turn-helix domain-containing protein [Acidipropionibacterium jensenii]VEI04152.1 Bacterial regulatory protein, Fis family [Acidipropionibacterium jensenii]
MSNTPRQQAAAEVRAAIARSGANHQDVADALGISRRGLTRKLGGERPFTVDEFVKVAAITSTDAGSLLNAAYGISGEQVA